MKAGARGLDIPALSHVFSFEVPVHADDYVHRAGRSGKAFMLATGAESKAVDAIKGLIGRDIA